ncbi:MAG: SRPBCC family protein [Myxococcales bacterium]|nr:SRPBCC family protein [Myxococcales bacterium]
MLKKLLILVALLVVVLVAVIATRPSTYRVERSAAISTPPELVFAQVSDFHKWAAWSPWEKLDPNQKKTFEGPEAGVGASHHWSGNDQVGEGKMTITALKPSERIDIKLEFIRPWQATNSVEFLFKPEQAGTQVTWAVNGNNDFMGKAMTLFMDMDQMMGKDFEQGLANLKALAEAEQKKQLAETEAAKKAAEAAAAPADAAAPPAPAQ